MPRTHRRESIGMNRSLARPNISRRSEASFKTRTGRSCCKRRADVSRANENQRGVWNARPRAIFIYRSRITETYRSRIGQDVGWFWHRFVYQGPNLCVYHKATGLIQLTFGHWPQVPGAKDFLSSFKTTRVSLYFVDFSTRYRLWKSLEAYRWNFTKSFRHCSGNKRTSLELRGCVRNTGRDHPCRKREITSRRRASRRGVCVDVKQQQPSGTRFVAPFSSRQMQFEFLRARSN